MTAELASRVGRSSALPRPGTRARLLQGSVLVAIGGLAFVLRLLVLLRGGGLTGIGGYDDGVYYAAADALLHGRLPYASFLFLQPPGIALAATPFAAIGSVFGDPAGLVAGRLAFEAVGAVNAVLVVLVLRRFGRVSAVVGGVAYAVLLPAVYAERSILLEPLGTLGVLICLLLLSRRASGRLVVAAGVAAGSAVDVKIWYVVPLLVVGLVATRHRVRYGLGAAGAMLAGYGPFVLAAPAAAVREIVLDQLGRPRSNGFLGRIATIVGARAVHGVPLRAVAGIFVVLVAAAVVATLLTRGARVFSVLFLADGVVLLAAPSWFPHYAALTAPPLALCIGVGAGRLVGLLPRRAGRARPALAALLCAGVLCAGLATDRVRSGTGVPTALVAAVRSTPGCVTADDPTILAATDVLSRDLTEPDCVIWPDVTGWTYDADGARTASGRPVARAEDRRWQRAVVGYLQSGNALLTVRPATGLSAASKAELHRRPALAVVGRYELLPGSGRG